MSVFCGAPIICDYERPAAAGDRVELERTG